MFFLIWYEIQIYTLLDSSKLNLNKNKEEKNKACELKIIS